MIVITGKSIKYAFLIFTIVGACSCANTDKRVTRASSPLKDYIQAQNYEPFDIPRSGSGVGVLASYPGQVEQIEAERTECLPENGVKHTQRDSSLPTYYLNSSSNAEASIFANAISNSRLNLEAAFSDQRVKVVKISFKDPFEQWITPNSIEIFLDKGGVSKPCIDNLMDQNTFVILRVLGAKSVSFQFLDSSQNTLKLGAQFLQNIGLNVNATPTLENQLELRTDKPMLLGYRLWQMNPTEGLSGDAFELSEVQINEIPKR